MSTEFAPKPKNKHLTVKAVAKSEKVGAEGLIYAPGNMQEGQYRQGTVTAVAECEEAETEDIQVGDVILYDGYGAVDHRVGNTTVTTVPIRNVLLTLSECPRARAQPGDNLEDRKSTRLNSSH